MYSYSTGAYQVTAQGCSVLAVENVSTKRNAPDLHFVQRIRDLFVKWDRVGLREEEMIQEGAKADTLSLDDPVPDDIPSCTVGSKLLLSLLPALKLQ